MDPSSRIASERYAILTVVVAAHLVALLLVPRIHRSPSELTSPNLRNPEPLQWLELTEAPLQATPGLQSGPPGRSHARHGAKITVLPLATLAERSLQTPPVDWNLEAERAARATVDQMAQREKRKCDDSGESRPPGILLPKCKEPKPAFGWDPDPKRVGLIGILPYVRLGQRCVVGLGFFGCALGKLPEANGHLFDEMSDPERDRLSVPEAGK